MHNDAHGFLFVPARRQLDRCRDHSLLDGLRRAVLDDSLLSIHGIGPKTFASLKGRLGAFAENDGVPLDERDAGTATPAWGEV